MPSIQRTRVSAAIAIIASTLLAAGCHEYVYPWQDETVGPELVTTASASTARAEPLDDRIVVVRDIEPTVITPPEGAVAHFPLWFQDPFEDRGSMDGQFAWTYADYLAMPYGLSRFILNGIALPISAVVHPPVPAMVSDGVLSRQALGYDHDADWRPGIPASIPPDVLEVGAIPPAAGEPEA